MNNEKRKKIAIAFPELASQMAQENTEEAIAKIDNDANGLLKQLLGSVKLLEGDKGDQGIQGEKGDKGDQGDKGEKGDKGEEGIQGEKGDRGPRGVDGIDGLDGKDGVDGKDGKDAVLDVEIIKPIVDETVLEGMKKIDGRIKAIDQRWHGAGLSKVAHDTTLTGSGTPSDPLSVNESLSPVQSVSNSDGSLTISPTTGAVVASLNIAHTNAWTARQSITSTDTTSGVGALDVSRYVSPSNSSSTFFYGVSNVITKNSGDLTRAAGGLYGYYNQVVNSLGDLTRAIGQYSQIVTVLGNITDAIGVYTDSPVKAASGTITNAYGFYAEAQKVTGVTTGYGFYSAGASDINYFAGKVGIGTVTPGYKLTLNDTAGVKLNLAGGTGGTGQNGILFDAVSGVGADSFYLYNGNAPGDAGFGLYDVTSNAWRLWVNNGGDVGVGTTNPGAKLDIAGGQLTFSSDTSTFNAVGIGRYQNILLFNTGSGGLRINNSSNSATLSTISDTGQAYFAGNVGIGTASPIAPLDFGASLGNKIILYPGSTTNSYGLGVQSALFQMFAPSMADIAFGTGGSGAFTENMRITSGGNVGIGTNNPIYKLVVYDASDGAGFNFNANTQVISTTYGNGGSMQIGVTDAGAGAMTGANIFLGGSTRGDTGKNATRFLVDTTEYMRIDGDISGHILGNVGIGTSAPANKLSVVGDVDISGLTASKLVLTDGSKKLVSGTADSLVAAGSVFIVGKDRATGQTAAKALATYTVGASDSSYLVSANILITSSTLYSFSTTCSYTDESNTARVLTLNFSQLTGAFVTTLTNALGASAYEGVPVHIRCKAGTTIIVATTGTFTTVTYNLEEMIQQIA